MMERLGMVMSMTEILFIVCLPLFPVAAGLGAAQAFLAQKRLPCPFLLPALTGSAVAYCAHQKELVGSSMRGYRAAARIAEMIWSVPLAWSGLVLAGVLAGWVMGYVLKRERTRREVK